jgi:hypothetical protein
MNGQNLLDQPFCRSGDIRTQVITLSSIQTQVDIRRVTMSMDVRENQ